MRQTQPAHPRLAAISLQIPGNCIAPSVPYSPLPGHRAYVARALSTYRRFSLLEAGDPELSCPGEDGVLELHRCVLGDCGVLPPGFATSFLPKHRSPDTVRA